MEGKKKKGLKISNVVIDLPKGLAYDGSTGEMIEESDIDELIEDAKKEKLLHEATTKALFKIFEVDEESIIYKYDWKKKSYFNKVYRVEGRNYLDNVKPTPDAALIILHIQYRLEFKTNRVITNDSKPFTNKDFQILTGLSPKKVKNALQELEDVKFIKRIGNTRNREIYVNPYIISTGNVIDREILQYFDDYEPNAPY